MPTLIVKVREKFGRRNKELRENGIIPAILYGPKIKNIPLEVNLNEIESVYQDMGESSLIHLAVISQANSEKKDNFSVLIHKVKKDPLTGKLSHIDFYQPLSTEEVEAVVSLLFKGDSPAVKNFGGTLVKEIKEVTIKALPQNLPRDIDVDISKLEKIGDEILIKDLQLPKNVKIERDSDDIVAKIVHSNEENESEQQSEKEIEQQQ